jgi:hypothetical protein
MEEAIKAMNEAKDAIIAEIEQMTAEVAGIDLEISRLQKKRKELTVKANRAVMSIKEMKIHVRPISPLRSSKKTFPAQVFHLLETEELSPREICERLGKDLEDIRSRFSKLYSKSGLIGRRRKKIDNTYTYLYAQKSWYDLNGIKAAYPGDSDVSVD